MIFLALKFPSAKKQVDDKLAETRQKIDDKVMPKDPNIVRHLALPKEGRTAEWIAEEMERMDRALESGSYKDGKLSGAVYRKPPFFFICSSQNVMVNRWRRGYGEYHRGCFPKVLRFQSTTSRCFPDSTKDGSRGSSHVPTTVRQPRRRRCNDFGWDRVHHYVRESPPGLGVYDQRNHGTRDVGFSLPNLGPRLTLRSKCYSRFSPCSVRQSWSLLESQSTHNPCRSCNS